VDVNLINSVYSYDKLLNSTQTYFDYIDPLQGKILGVARRNIDYIGAVDPASYNTGTVHNIGTSWGPLHEGEVWWDTNSVRFVEANQDNIVYASRRWGQVFPGSTIDIYQWTSSSVPPINYTGTGTPFSNTSYTVHSSIDDQGLLVTTYYFWVRGITTVATSFGKTLSSTAIASYILNPSSSGLPYIAALSANAIAIYNATSLLSAFDTIIHVEYDRLVKGGDNDIHSEYAFIADGKADAFLNDNLYRKLLDSFCGTTTTGAAVPDPLLSPGMQYGVQFRPRQSMFINRFKALENYLGRANTVLAQYPISETRSFNLLNSSEPTPVANSGAWDFEVPTLEILYYQDLALVPIGYLYLVLSDTSYNGRWTTYQVAEGSLPGQRVLELVQVQNYDTPLYWNYINWYLPGYNSSIQPIVTVANTAGLQTLSLNTAPIGSSVKVTANGQGKFEIYLRTAAGTTTDWKRVGLEDGTIEFSSVLWDYPSGGFGFDSQVFDSQFFDQEPVIETRQIIKAINQELFVGDLLIERNQALMLVFQYIYSEYNSPNWLVKTSYINVDHVIRGLLPYQLYQPDNQTFVLNYLNEVKPYHVQNLAFNLIYDGIDSYSGNLTDYDVPAFWNIALDLPQFVSPILTPYTYSDSVAQSFISDTAPDAQIWLERPWSDWFNNYLLNIQEVTIINGGSGYTIAPDVVVSGTCVTPAEMTAVINSAGRIVAVNIINPGVGYSTTAEITFVGGNGSGAIAVAQMNNSLVRSIKTTIKYDRCEYFSTVYEWQANVVYNQGDQVRWNNRVWSSNITQSTSVFNAFNWTEVPASSLNAADRTMGFYVPTVNMPGLSLPLLIDGLNYPGVQVSAPAFNQNTGFDVGNYDINPFDNISVNANGGTTYDPGILDAQYSSAYVDPYLGMRPTDINVDGGGYIDVFSSYAPQELVPGSEFDTLDFRVYTTPGADWQGLGHGFPTGSRRYIFDPANPTLSFEGVLDSPMVVILFNATLGLAVEPLSYNWANYELTVDPTTSLPGDTLVINVAGTGGGNQLMSGTYLGSEMISGNEIIIPFPTSSDPIPPIDSIYEFVIYNGEIPLVEGVDYTYAAFGDLKTKITFTNTYDDTNRINLTALGYGYNGTTYSWSLPVFETILVTNSTQLTYTLTNSLQGTNPVNLIVVRNGTRARPYEGVQYISDGFTTNYYLPADGGYSQGLIADNDVLVYLNQQPQTLNVDFVVDPWDGSSDRTITLLNGAPAEGVVVLISVKTAAQYWISGNELTFRPSTGLSPQEGDLLEIITWNDTAEQGILTLVFVGPNVEGITISEGYDSVDFDSATITNTSGSYDFSIGDQVETNTFNIGRPILDPERLLVTLNGNWLFNGLGYVTSGSNIIILGPTLPAQSELVITVFTQSVVPNPMAFRIFQDMRGVQATYRITPSTTTVTTASVAANDDIIYVSNINALQEPDFNSNVWGVITIDAERIMYRYRDTVNGTISGLMRGTAGTAVTAHNNGATVYNIGRGNLLPKDYQDYIVSSSTISTGTATYIAEDINLLPEDSTLRLDALEVYVGGIKQSEHFIGDGSTLEFALSGIVALTDSVVTINGVLQVDGVDYSIDTTALTFVTAPASETIVQVSSYTLIANNPVEIAFETAPAAGLEVLILVRRGVTWYQQGDGTPSNGKPLQLTNTVAARFLRGL
jgi:hypothetical protein